MVVMDTSEQRVACPDTKTLVIADGNIAHSGDGGRP